VTRVSKSVALALCLFATQFVADAQESGKLARIGILVPGSPSTHNYVVEPLRQGLGELGYVEGLSFAIVHRWAEGKFDRLPGLAAELVRLKVDVIVAFGPPAIRAAQQATRAIPIVMAITHEPVAMGFVASLARPGGNITGMAFQDSELATKRLELLKAAVPVLSRVAALWDPSGGGPGALAATEHAAGSLGLKLGVVETAKPTDFDRAFESARRGGAQAMIQLASPLHSAHRRRIIDLAMNHRLPATCESAQFVHDGCLMSYGPKFPEMSRRAASYVDRILKGAKPADLPVEQPTRFELVINLKTAKALGLTIPQSLLLRADHVIR